MLRKVDKDTRQEHNSCTVSSVTVGYERTLNNNDGGRGEGERVKVGSQQLLLVTRGWGKEENELNFGPEEIQLVCVQTPILPAIN